MKRVPHIRTSPFNNTVATQRDAFSFGTKESVSPNTISRLSRCDITSAILFGTMQLRLLIEHAILHEAPHSVCPWADVYHYVSPLIAKTYAITFVELLSYVRDIRYR